MWSTKTNKDFQKENMPSVPVSAPAEDSDLVFERHGRSGARGFFGFEGFYDGSRSGPEGARSWDLDFSTSTARQGPDGIDYRV